MLAVNEGQGTVVTLLVAREDVDMNSRDDSGWTPLSLAIKNGREGLVRLLRAG
jgi:ankyrin repeat protein